MLGNLRPLFQGHSTLRAVIDSVLEGRLGEARVDDPDSPRTACLEIGCYAIFGGDPGAEGAHRLVAAVSPPRELVIPPRDDWRRLLHSTREGLVDCSMRTYDAGGLDPERLASWRETPAAGIAIRPIDSRLARQLDEGLRPHGLQVFPDADAFAAGGLGFGALDDDRLVCAATSYAVSTERLEVAISCRTEYRRRGLARATAAALLAECLRRGLTPEWSASNPVSQHLAETLGYRPAGRCEVLVAES